MTQGDNDDLAHIESKKELYRNAWLGITFLMVLVVTSLWYFNPSKPEGEVTPPQASVKVDKEQSKAAR